MKRTFFSLALLLILLITPNQVVHAREMTNQSDNLYISESDLNDSTYTSTKQKNVEVIVFLMGMFGMHTFIINTTNRLPIR